ncbi:MAG: hypothetical protein KDC35_17315 [Acidobacteria bacterium]|nr:hypothetical protein [Acidobacteriota bacterium]
MPQILALLAANALTINQAHQQLQCSLSSENEGWFRLEIRNTSDTQFSGDIAPVVNLSTATDEIGDFWAPLDPYSGHSYGPNQSIWIKLEPGEMLKVRLDPRDLLWDLVFSSVWPNRPLNQVVPTGRYVLYVALDGLGSYSNRLSFDW